MRGPEEGRHQRVAGGKRTDGLCKKREAGAEIERLDDAKRFGGVCAFREGVVSPRQRVQHIVEHPVREPRRSARALGSVGAEDRKCGPVTGGFVITDRRIRMLHDQVVHEDGSRSAFEQMVVVLVVCQLCRPDRRAAEARVHIDHAAEAEFLLRRFDLLPDFRRHQDIADDQVRDLLLCEHILPHPVRAKKLIREKRDLRAGHVEAEEGKQRLGRDDPADCGPRAVLRADAEGGEGPGISLPLAEHLPVGVFACAVDERGAVHQPVIGADALFDISPYLLAADAAVLEPGIDFSESPDRLGRLFSALVPDDRLLLEPREHSVGRLEAPRVLGIRDGKDMLKRFIAEVDQL